MSTALPRLKWFTTTDSARLPNEIREIQSVGLFVQSAERGIVAFTLLETRQLDESFFAKLRSRQAQWPDPKDVWVLQVPPFLEHRAKTHIAKHPQLRIDLECSPFLSIRNAAGRFLRRSKIRVMNVDDSPVLLKFLGNLFTELGYAEVVGQVSQSRNAADEILRLQPDFVTLDIQMPEKNGVDVVRELSPLCDTPLLMVSSLSLDEGSLVFEALQAGAFDYVQKPRLEDRSEFREALEERLLAALRGRGAHSALQKSKPRARASLEDWTVPERLVWTLGSSTGGTQALTRVLTSLPHEIPPTLVVQHIPPVFSKAFAESLDNLCPFRVKEAEDLEWVQSGTVYIAPGGRQMKPILDQGRLRLRINDDPPVNRFQPSVDYLFNALAELSDWKIVSGILTGMGRDGAEGQLRLRQAGAQTFAQDEATSVVYGMPRAAHEIGATLRSVGLDDVASTLLDFSRQLRKAA
jgi:two-component system chemotaxis response regulator CheB